MTVTSPAQKRAHYPSQLKLFGDCRRRYFLKVVERRRVEEPFSSILEKGKVAHDVIKTCIQGVMQKEPRLPANLQRRVAQRLPREPYSSDLAWESDETEVVAWVKYAL